MAKATNLEGKQSNVPKSESDMFFLVRGGWPAILFVHADVCLCLCVHVDFIHINRLDRYTSLPVRFVVTCQIYHYYYSGIKYYSCGVIINTIIRQEEDDMYTISLPGTVRKNQEINRLLGARGETDVVPELYSLDIQWCLFYTKSFSRYRIDGTFLIVLVLQE